jgi:hypothetical protein
MPPLLDDFDRGMRMVLQLAEADYRCSIYAALWLCRYFRFKPVSVVARFAPNNRGTGAGSPFFNLRFAFDVIAKRRARSTLTLRF